MANMSALSLLASIGVLSLLCQWLAWRIKIPAILPLLICGLLVGPGISHTQSGSIIR